MGNRPAKPSIKLGGEKKGGITKVKIQDVK